ncbi:SRPBCC family protein [Saccharolobus caldissimus]|uniref:SRPBCC family protein n=1 Tax=Saccharolobus caldissimus TaxID=1702097 RepID=A0AAQ4CWP5_9CREN|nr:SRPBCC family protein [Saccharolobus caldissimus]BDC00227.1 hypothetical protein SACC_32430 [Saccharolobus caldissimus]
MIRFSVSKEMNCDPSIVWEIVKNVNSFPKYWHGTRELNIKEIRKNVYEGTIRFVFPTSGKVRISIYDNERKIIIEYLDGPFTGRSVIKVENRAIISEWEVNMKGFYKLFEKWNKKHFKEGTINALERIITEANKNLSSR